jgi:multiple sugar transport system substrate-binding protein
MKAKSGTFLVCVSLIGIMSAAGVNAGAQKDSTAASGGTKPITLKFFSNEAVMQEAFDKINTEYTKQNPNVNIEVLQIPSSDYGVKVDTTILSGEQVDVVYFNIMKDYAVRAMQGELTPMDDLLAKEGIKLLDVYSIDAKVDDGKIYALPGDVKIMLVWLNKNDLDRAGLKTPDLNWTWDDYREYAKKLTWGDGPNKHYGSMWYTWQHYDLLDVYNEINGNPYINRDGSHNLNHPSFRSALEFRRTLELEDKTQIPLSEVLAMKLDYRSVFMSGRASMTITMTNIIPQISQTKDFPHDFVTTFAPVPKPKNGGRDGYCYGDNRFYSIGKTTVNAEETYKYLRYFTIEGIPMKNVSFTAEKTAKIPLDEMVDKMTSGNPALYDIPQLKRLLNWPSLHANIWDYSPVFTSELDAIYRAEADKATMGEITVDQVFKNAIPQFEQVIARNLKK